MVKVVSLHRRYNGGCFGSTSRQRYAVWLDWRVVGVEGSSVAILPWCVRMGLCAVWGENHTISAMGGQILPRMNCEDWLNESVVEDEDDLLALACQEEGLR